MKNKGIKNRKVKKPILKNGKKQNSKRHLKNKCNVHIGPSNIEIKCKNCLIPHIPNTSITSGTTLTGFIDVEKVITVKKPLLINGCRRSKKRCIFLEKKLPFQVLLLELNASDKLKKNFRRNILKA